MVVSIEVTSTAVTGSAVTLRTTFDDMLGWLLRLCGGGGDSGGGSGVKYVRSGSHAQNAQGLALWRQVYLRSAC